MKFLNYSTDQRAGLWKSELIKRKNSQYSNSETAQLYEANQSTAALLARVATIAVLALLWEQPDVRVSTAAATPLIGRMTLAPTWKDRVIIDLNAAPIPSTDFQAGAIVVCYSRAMRKNDEKINYTRICISSDPRVT